jgi:flagellar motor switch protein FliM
VYQFRIEYRIVGWQEMPLGEAADRLVDSDRIVLFEVEPHADLGFVWLSRPLLFALLGLIFGARPGRPRCAIPERPYTRIEERVYQRLAQETLDRLGDCFEGLTDMRSRVLSFDAPARLRADAHDRVVVGTLDVQGLGDICRMRFGLPRAPFEALRAPIRAVQPGRRAALAHAVTEMPMKLRVELGSAEMSLSELAALREGSVIPVDAAVDGSLLVRIGGRPKFRAIRGTVGQKLAVQLTGRLEHLQEVSDG